MEHVRPIIAGIMTLCEDPDPFLRLLKLFEDFTGRQFSPEQREKVHKAVSEMHSQVTSKRAREILREAEESGQDWFADSSQFLGDLESIVIDMVRHLAPRDGQCRDLCRKFSDCKSRKEKEELFKKIFKLVIFRIMELKHQVYGMESLIGIDTKQLICTKYDEIADLRSSLANKNAEIKRLQEELRRKALGDDDSDDDEAIKKAVKAIDECLAWAGESFEENKLLRAELLAKKEKEIERLRKERTKTSYEELMSPHCSSGEE